MERPIKPWTEDQLAWLSACTERATRKAIKHYLARAAIAYLVLAVGFAAAWERSGDRVETIDQNVAHVQELREARVIDSQSTDRIICRRQNRVYSILRSAVKTSTDIRDDEGLLDPRRRAASEKLLRQLKPLNCRRLPNARSFEG